MSHSQFHSIKCLYLDMHGLIFETSIWLLAGSTRFLSLPVDAHLRGYQPIEKRWGLLETRPFVRASRTPGPSRYGFMSWGTFRCKKRPKPRPAPSRTLLTFFLYSTSLSFPHAKQPERQSIRLLSTAIGGSLETLPFGSHLTNRPSHSPK